MIQLFSLCEGEFYYDPVKKLWRLKDGSCLAMRDSFHENLNKYYAALFWSELARKTDGGAGLLIFFILPGPFWSHWDRSDNPGVPSVLISASWRFLDMEGVQPDLSSCARCGRAAPEYKAVCYDGEGHCGLFVLPSGKNADPLSRGKGLP